MQPTITLILPTYGQFKYARSCLISWFESRDEARVSAIVIDDGSPDWNEEWLEGIDGDVRIFRFPENGQLTRSWNKGFEMAWEMPPDFVVAGNSDLVFARGWWHGISESLRNGLDFAGPLSNAPGITNPDQQVQRWHFTYQLSDATDEIDATNSVLWNCYRGQYAEGPINGFCMIATASNWKRIADGPTISLLELTGFPGGQ